MVRWCGGATTGQAEVRRGDAQNGPKRAEGRVWGAFVLVDGVEGTIVRGGFWANEGIEPGNRTWGAPGNRAWGAPAVSCRTRFATIAQPATGGTRPARERLIRSTARLALAGRDSPREGAAPRSGYAAALLSAGPAPGGNGKHTR